MLNGVFVSYIYLAIHVYLCAKEKMQNLNLRIIKTGPASKICTDPILKKHAAFNQVFAIERTVRTMCKLNVATI